MRGTFENISTFIQKLFQREKIPQFAPNGKRLSYQNQVYTGNYFQNYGKNQNHGNKSSCRNYKGNGRNNYAGNNSRLHMEDTTMSIREDILPIMIASMTKDIFQKYGTSYASFAVSQNTKTTLSSSYVSISGFSHRIQCQYTATVKYQY